MRQITVEKVDSTNWLIGIPTSRNGKPVYIYRAYRLVDNRDYNWTSINNGVVDTIWRLADSDGMYVVAIKAFEKENATMQVFY